jgi:tetratricopeptide (TPR) repeat protein
MADTLHFYSLKIPAYISMFNQYLRRDQPEKALAFFNSDVGKGVQEQFGKFGMGAMMDQAYGITYTALNRFDSAAFYLERAKPFFERSTNADNKMYFWSNLGTLSRKMGLTDQAIGYYLELIEMGKQSAELQNVEYAAKELDSLYAMKGDYRQAHYYNSLYNIYKDSIETLGKEKELAQEEAADEQARQQRLLEEQAEQARRRNNIQYLAITLGIIGLFIALVVLGMLKVSASLIRAVGFFTFLLFFEFIFLIFKKNIHAITHGEPWKDLAFMIALAALLVPLHHTLEKKVLGYLTSHNRLTRAGAGIRQRIFRKPGRGGS